MKLQKGMTVPEWHQLQIAKKTVKMSPAMAAILGGMSVDEAKAIVNKWKKGGK